MATIYKNSFLTIAASAAASDQDGFLENRRPFLGRKLQYNIPGFPHKLIEIRRSYIDYHYEYPERINPLDKRAWAFQEQLMPLRVLSFRSSGVRWQCQKSGLV